MSTRPGAPGAYAVTVTHSWAAFEPRWQAACTHCQPATPFQRPEWLRAWFSTIGSRRDREPILIAVTATATGEDALLVPLVRRRIGPARVIEFADAWVTDYNAPAIGPACPVDEQAEAVLIESVMNALSDADYLDLRKMPMRLGSRRNPLCRLPGAVPSTFAGNLIDASSGWQGVLDRMGSRKASILRKRRRLQERGSFRAFQPTGSAERLQLLDTLQDFQLRRLDAIGARTVLAEESHQAFYRALIADAPAMTPLTAIEFEGRIIAVALLCENGTSGVLVRYGYADGEMSAFGLGNIVVMEAMERAIQHGVRTLDLSIGDSEWKKSFRPDPVALMDVRRAVRPAGYVLAGVRRSLAGAKAFRNRLAAIKSGRRQPSG